MKNVTELRNGFIIFLGIGLFFLAMDFFGLSNKNYLRALNAFIVIYGINKTIKMNLNNGITNYLENFISGFKISLNGKFSCELFVPI